MDKPIPIDGTPGSRQLIKDALRHVNKTAKEHTYTYAGEIEAMAQDAEAHLDCFLSESARPGAMWTETSGSHTPDAYKYQRKATTVVLKRSKDGWRLVDVRSTSVGAAGGGMGVLALTQAQADMAVAAFKSLFRVQEAK